MIMAFLTRLGLASVPRWAWVAGGIVALVAACFVWLHFHDRAVIRDYEAGVQAKVEEKTDAAKAAATEAVATTQSDVAESNAKASEAAKDSDDPLKAFLEALK